MISYAFPMIFDAFPMIFLREDMVLGIAMVLIAIRRLDIASEMWGEGECQKGQTGGILWLTNGIFC